MARMRTARRLALCALVSAIAAAATLPARGQTQAPTFRAGVELVAVDFMAVTKDGSPVADLQPRDLTLKVNGRVRDIRELQFIKLGPEDGDARPPAMKTVPLAFGTNSAGEIGRNVIFLFDDNTILPGDERPAREAAGRFLDAMSPHDRIAVATRARIEVDLTTNHRLVRDGLNKVMGHAPGGSETRATGTSIEQAGSPTAWLRTFLLGLKDIDGPKTVIMISQAATVRSMNKAGVTLFDYKDVAEAAFIARAQLYIIQPHNFEIEAGKNASELGRGSDDAGFTPTSWTTGDAIGGLADLAGVTGGEVFRLSGSADQVFQHIVRQSSAYYLLGFAPDADERNGKTHRIEISVSRPGVTIRARQAFAIPRPTPAAVAGPTLPVMLGDLKTYRDVPLRVGAFTARSPRKNQLDIVVVAESVDPAISLGQVAFGLIDTAARKIPLAWPVPAAGLSNDRATSGGVLPPGTYRVRVAAISKDGRRGAAEYEFVAGLATTTPIEVGDLMVGQSQPDGSFQPQLLFGARPAATAYVELQGALARGTAISATFDLAQTLDGPTLASTSGIIVPAEKVPNRWSARAVIPIGNMATGEYIVRASIKVDGAIVAQPTRALRVVH